MPLVLLHGFGVDHRLLLSLDPVFEEVGTVRRLYVDLPATAGTPIGDVSSADDVAVAIADEIRHRVGEEPFAVLGSSFGGMIARQIAHDFRPQVLGLAVLAGVFVADHDLRTLPPKTVLVEDPGSLIGLGAVADDYAELAVVQGPENAQAFLEYAYPGLSTADPTGLERIAARYALTRQPEDAWPEPFTQPSLFITARQDHVVGDVDAWARIDHYPRATFVNLDAAGHNVHLDRPVLTAALIADWLHRVAQQREESLNGAPEKASSAAIHIVDRTP